MSEPGILERRLRDDAARFGKQVYEDSEFVRWLRAHDAEDARRDAEKRALEQALLVAHEYCCDDFEVPCTPENCQIQQALTGDARAIDRLTRGSSVAAIANRDRALKQAREALVNIERILNRRESNYAIYAHGITLAGLAAIDALGPWDRSED